MKYAKLNQDKGVAGLNILLSVISMLFVIGIILMVFTIAGTKLKESVSTDAYKELTTVTNETGAYINTTGYTLDGASNYLASGFAITSAINTSTNGTITLANISVSSAGVVTNATSSTFQGVWISYTYLYLKDKAAVNTINATYQSLGETTDWYPTFIVLAAMVVLILLLAIIINSIRGSGLMGEGGA